VCCFLAVKSRYYVLISGQRTSVPDLVVYQIDDVHRVVAGSDVALLINIQERVVLELQDGFAKHLGPVFLYKRDALVGVVLGDGVKGDERDGYHFVDGGVDIRFGPGERKRELHVPL
jgi:hypothetical protein